MRCFGAVVALLVTLPFATADCIPWPKPQTCTPSKSGCAFWPCLESVAHCGPNGYPAGYINPVCESLQAKLPQFTRAGRRWIADMGYCIMEAQVPASQCQTSCEDILAVGWTSHIECFLKTGFCTLPGNDLKIFMQTLGLDLTVSDTILDLASSTLQECVAAFKNGTIHGGWVEWVVKTLNGGSSGYATLG
ncbi:hypothetical protein TWF696_004988 [Orbilia brochopaga]|uniref:Uncharacterized protein n=1 Tax=Orbilia brochopaga TaxID=3140254 RepID=A0AAV9V2G4_9PEZI